MITRKSQFEARCLKWSKGYKINPLRILEMGTFWKIEWWSVATPYTIISNSNVHVPVLANSQFSNNTLLLSFWVRVFIFENREISQNWRFSLYTIVLITRKSQFEARCLKWSKGYKINPLRILEMGTFWKIEWWSVATPYTIISNSNVHVPVLANSQFSNNTLLLSFWVRVFIFENREISQNWRFSLYTMLRKTEQQMPTHIWHICKPKPTS